MTYTRVYYQILLTSISIGLLRCAKLENGCKRSVASKEEALPQLECIHLPKMNLPPDVRSLTVQGDLRVIDRKVLETSSILHILNISTCNITFIQDRAFNKMNQLVTLILSNNHIEYIEEDTFSNLFLLKELHLDGNNLKVILPGSFKDTTHLQILNLGNNQLLETPAELPKYLVFLNLANNDIENIDLEGLKNMEHLETLNFINNSIKSWPKGNLNLPSLRNLYLGSSLTSAQITGFSYPNLKHLHLSAKSIDNANFQGIKITDVHSLEELMLENYKIYDLQFLKHFEKLKTLYFTSIRYFGEDVTLLPSDLTKLYLETSPEIAKALLSSGKKFHKLRILSFKNSNITIFDDNQAKQLMKTVSSLDISQNPIRCSTEEWSWIFARTQIHPSFLIDNDNVICNTPPEVKGKTLLTVLHGFFSSEEQRKITFMSIMEEYAAVYGNERQNNLNESETIDEHELQNYILYGILIMLTLMGTLCLFVHICYKKEKCTSHQSNITIEYSQNNEQINFRKTTTFSR